MSKTSESEEEYRSEISESVKERRDLEAEEEDEDYRLLQQNHPRLSHVYIYGLKNDKARRYGQSLQHSSVLESIINIIGSSRVLLLGNNNEDLDLLFEFIEILRRPCHRPFLACTLENLIDQRDGVGEIDRISRLSEKLSLLRANRDQT
jgi:hypothetical protein